MALRGVTPNKIQKRLKALFYGTAGVGKSTAALGFPRPYVIDCERGMENQQYTDALQQGGGVIFQTADFDEVLNEVKSLLTEPHEYKTLVIDPLTVLYNDLLDKSAIKVGTEFGRHYGEANKKIKNLLSLLLRLDMNIIITSHAKEQYGQNMAVLGNTFDCYKKLDYLFDLVFEIQKRGSERVGLVKKSRVSGFPDGEVFDFNYAEIAKRYGIQVLEKECESESLADKTQVTELFRLINLLKVSQEVWQKWLDKGASETFDEMKSDDIQKCINYLKSKIEGAE